MPILQRLRAIKDGLESPDLLAVAGLRGRALRAVSVLYHAACEFRRDFCFERAASLTFATLVSLIPLAVLFYSFAVLLGGGERIIAYVEDNFLSYFVPEFQDRLRVWLREYISPDAFREGAAGLVNLGALLGLLLAALAVLTTAERIFNRIWKVKRGRSYLQRLAAFWLVLTASPFLIAGSIVLQGILVPKGGVIDRLTARFWFLEAVYGFIVPVGVGCLAFTLMYVFLPRTRVRMRSALAGALLAALLWELSKRGFYYYVRYATTVTNFYKQLAMLPLFLIWIYVTWVIVLFGAEVTYVGQNLTRLLTAGDQARKEAVARPRVAFALYLLLLAERRFRTGAGGVRVEEAAAELGETAEDAALTARTLVEEGFLVEEARRPGTVVLARHPRTVSLAAVVGAVLRGQDFDASAVKPLRPKLEAEFGAEAAASWEELVTAVFAAPPAAIEGWTLEDLARGRARGRVPAAEALDRSSHTA